MTSSQTSVSPIVSRCRFLAAAILGAYLILNVLLKISAPLTAHWPTYGVTAVAVPPMVLAMIYVVIPIARRVGTR
jgi:hypothetical protein